MPHSSQVQNETPNWAVILLEFTSHERVEEYETVSLICTQIHSHLVEETGNTIKCASASGKNFQISKNIANVIEVELSPVWKVLEHLFIYFRHSNLFRC